MKDEYDAARIEDLRRYTAIPDTQRTQPSHSRSREALGREPYIFDRRFRSACSMGHSRFAEYIGARTNTQVNAACASTTQAIGLAED
jgi:hypothetical protein